MKRGEDIKIAYRIVILTVTILMVSTPFNKAECQARKATGPPPPLAERLFYGGNFGLQLGTITNIQVSPVIGIWLLPRVAVAAGPVYQYYKSPLGETDIWGQRLFTQFVVFRNIEKLIPLGTGTSILFHGEYEGLALESKFWTTETGSGRFYTHSILVGPAISQQMGRRSSMYISVLWALNESEFDLYGNPEIRFGFLF